MAEPAAPKKGDEFVALLSPELPAAVAVAKVCAGARGPCHARVRGRSCAHTERRCPPAASAQRSGEPITLNFANAEIEAVARTMATITGLVVSDVISHEAATSFIHIVMLAASHANHSPR